MTPFSKLAQQIVTPKRMQKMENVLADRTQYIVPVFENLYITHNASAVLRSCDAFGINHAHFIESETEFSKHADIAQGSHNWIECFTHPNVDSCFADLRNKGYKLAATCLSNETITPEQLPVDTPIALVFGNELHGISKEAASQCDYHIKIPMYGFVDSFNISVSAALLFSSLLERVKAKNSINWQLTEQEKKHTFRRWLFYNTPVGKIATTNRRQKKRQKKALENLYGSDINHAKRR